MKIFKFNESFNNIEEIRDIIENYLIDEYQMEISYFGESKESKFEYTKNDKIYPKVLYRYQMPERMGHPFQQWMDGSGFNTPEPPLELYREVWSRDFIGLEIYINPEYFLLNLDQILESINLLIERIGKIDGIKQFQLMDVSFSNGILSSCESHSVMINWISPNKSQVKDYLKSIIDQDICFIQIFIK